MSICRAGGGGSKSKHRRARLKEKNAKLHDERKKQAAKRKTAETPSKRDKDSGTATRGMHDIHPSRQGRISGR